MLMEDTRELFLAWIDQFENNHYVFDMYGQEYVVDLDRETVESVLDISILLVDRVVAAKGVIHTSEYEKVEKLMREQYGEDSNWIFNTALHIHSDNHLYGRYKDIEPMIGKLSPRGIPMNSAAYLFLVYPGIQELIYAVIRHVDDVDDCYQSLIYTFFLGVLAKGWGEGNGWKKENGNWRLE